jgi:peptidoglycan/xylan/chitin deacetylase (PgdA/CDA1 family)
MVQQVRAGFLTFIFLVFCVPLSSAQGIRDSSKTVDMPLSEIRALVDRVGQGRSLLPDSWPGEARLAVLLSFDADDETSELRFGGSSINVLSDTQYGRVGLRRVVDLVDRHEIPASFFIPAVSLELDPGKAELINRSGRHEIALHGWIHENPASITRDQEKRALEKSIDSIRRISGHDPVGYRAPSWNFSEHTVDLLQEFGLLYDSSLMSDDSPFEILRNGQPTGIVELPVSWVPDDASYIVPRYPGSISPRDFLTILKDDFDVAYREGTMFLLTTHPDVIGRRSAIVILEELIDYIKSKPGIWFATHRQVAEYVARESGMEKAP